MAKLGGHHRDHFNEFAVLARPLVEVLEGDETLGVDVLVVAFYLHFCSQQTENREQSSLLSAGRDGTMRSALRLEVGTSGSPS